MNIVGTLNEAFSAQPFNQQGLSLSLEEYQRIAYTYSQIENSIAVLSDLGLNKSYVYKGLVAYELGLWDECVSTEINSIWEENIFTRIHPDDLYEKHMLELQFFNMMKNIDVAQRSHYNVVSRIRMLNKDGEYVFIKHRMFYMSTSDGSLRLALCLYNFSNDLSSAEIPLGMIVNSVTGGVINVEKQKTDSLLSVREIEILHLIRSGSASKDIADLLSISINTVSRHRQNILEKLCVNNSLEACRIAESMNLI